MDIPLKSFPLPPFQSTLSIHYTRHINVTIFNQYHCIIPHCNTFIRQIHLMFSNRICWTNYTTKLYLIPNVLTAYSCKYLWAFNRYSTHSSCSLRSRASDRFGNILLGISLTSLCQLSKLRMRNIHLYIISTSCSVLVELNIAISIDFLTFIRLIVHC